MKITFEGAFNDILDQMAALLERSGIKIAAETYAHAKTATAQPLQVDVAAVEKRLNEPWLKPVEPVEKPVEQKRARTEKQLANDEKLRERAQAKKAAGLKPFDKNPAPAKAVEKPVEKPVEEPEMFADPGEIINLRNKTITDLQEAYANGHQQEVFELLSRFGNGAKSFRELPPEAFGPIREAIDKGALT